MTPQFENCGAPAIWFKTLPKWAKKALFWFLVRVPPILEWGVISLAWIVAPSQDYNSTYFSWKLLQRAKYCGPLSRHSESDPLKVRILRGPSQKIRHPNNFQHAFFGCRIQWRSWFSHQTWSSFMTSSSYGHLKLSGQNGQKDIVIMALSKVIRVQEGFAEPQSGSPATKRPEWAEKRLVKSTPKIARSPLSGHRTAVTSVTNHSIFIK